MSRRKKTLSEARSFLYQTARVMGDIEAASRGPEAMARRIVRRMVGKATGSALRRLFH